MTSPLAPFLDGALPRARFSVRPSAPAALPRVDGLLAGAAEVDITPPPGLPKAGYSTNAYDGRGFRSRLRARVLHLRAGTVSLAIVQGLTTDADEALTLGGTVRLRDATLGLDVRVRVVGIEQSVTNLDDITLTVQVLTPLLTEASL
jgi:hypothetical protein